MNADVLRPQACRLEAECWNHSRTFTTTSKKLLFYSCVYWLFLRRGAHGASQIEAPHFVVVKIQMERDFISETEAVWFSNPRRTIWNYVLVNIFSLSSKARERIRLEQSSRATVYCILGITHRVLSESDNSRPKMIKPYVIYICVWELTCIQSLWTVRVTTILKSWHAYR